MDKKKRKLKDSLDMEQPDWRILSRGQEDAEVVEDLELEESE